MQGENGRVMDIWKQKEEKERGVTYFLSLCILELNKKLYKTLHCYEYKSLHYSIAYNMFHILES